MQDWKATPLPIVTLRGWGYHEARHRRRTSKARRPRRGIVRRAAAIVGGLLARAGG
jgi:hypothetical protein